MSLKQLNYNSLIVLNKYSESKVLLSLSLPLFLSSSLSLGRLPRAVLSNLLKLFFHPNLVVFSSKEKLFHQISIHFSVHNAVKTSNLALFRLLHMKALFKNPNVERTNGEARKTLALKKLSRSTVNTFFLPNSFFLFKILKIIFIYELLSKNRI